MNCCLESCQTALSVSCFMELISMVALLAGRGVEVRSDAIIAAEAPTRQDTMRARTNEGTGPGHHRTKMTSTYYQVQSLKSCLCFEIVCRIKIFAGWVSFLSKATQHHLCSLGLWRLTVTEMHIECKISTQKFYRRPVNGLSYQIVFCALICRHV